MADAATLDRYSEELFNALRTRSSVEPLTERDPTLTQDEAYQISLGILKRREAAGEKIVGKKIGATSRAVQDMLKVDQPDYGFLTDRMQCLEGVPVPISRELIQPRAEGEIAFVLKRDLAGPGVTHADVHHLECNAPRPRCMEPETPGVPERELRTTQPGVRVCLGASIFYVKLTRLVTGTLNALSPRCRRCRS